MDERQSWLLVVIALVVLLVGCLDLLLPKARTGLAEHISRTSWWVGIGALVTASQLNAPRPALAVAAGALGLALVTAVAASRARRSSLHLTPDRR